MQLLYVHGSEEHAPEAQLKDALDHAFYGRTLREDSEVAYWADLRPAWCYAQPGQSADIDSAEFRTFRSGLLSDINRSLGVKQLSPANMLWMSKPEPRFERMVRDLFLYFSDQSVREEIHRRFLSHVDRFTRCMTVAYGTGSVFAYDFLRTYFRDEMQLTYTYTICSPLALPTLQRELKRLAGMPEGGELAYPRGLVYWNNAIDKADPHMGGFALNGVIETANKQRITDTEVKTADKKQRFKGMESCLRDTEYGRCIYGRYLQSTVNYYVSPVPKGTLNPRPWFPKREPAKKFVPFDEPASWDNIRKHLDSVIEKQMFDAEHNANYPYSITKLIYAAAGGAQRVIAAKIDESVNDRSLGPIVQALEKATEDYRGLWHDEDGYGGGTFGAIISDIRSLQNRLETLSKRLD